jgi:hypothetical protein
MQPIVDGSQLNMRTTDDIFTNLVEWIYKSDACSPLMRSSSQFLEGFPTQLQSSSYFLHPNLSLDIDVGIHGDRTRVLRNNGTTIASGSSVMCIPTISVTPELMTAVISDANDVDKDANAVHLLAWHLSQKPQHLHPYLDSLPASSDLPRLWSDRTLHTLLLGSPIMKYIEETKRVIQSRYKQSQENHQNTLQEQNDKNLPAPTWDDYSHAHAMVTSRAFNYDVPVTKDSNACRIASLHMVPILDLCNHCRGGSHTMNEQNQKNVSYTFQKYGDKVADTIKSHNNGVVVKVVATKEILPNESIRITYGAKPNSVLLVNYGFTIPNNMEPDGSSNDILEFYPPSSSSSNNGTKRCDTTTTPITILRTGPPSYTYGCFTTALQAFFEAGVVNSTTPGQRYDGNDDDLEQFLDDCDEKENDDDDDDDENDDNNDEMYDDNDADIYLDTPPNDFIDNNSSLHNVSGEIQALQKFRKYLLELIDEYTLPKNTIMDWSNFITGEEKLDSCYTYKQNRQIYAANLIYSEIRILQFYIWVSERLQHQLLLRQDTNDERLDSTLTQPMLKLTNDDVQLLNRQVDDLISAYIKLRH